MKPMLSKNEISFLKRHLGAKEQDIFNAVAAVGNKPEKIELYLLQRRLVAQQRYHALRGNHKEIYL